MCVRERERIIGFRWNIPSRSVLNWKLNKPRMEIEGDGCPRRLDRVVGAIAGRLQQRIPDPICHGN